MLLNARYGPIGVSVAPYLTGSRWSRFLHAQLTVDESWAIAAEGDGRFNPRVLLGAGVTLYTAWVVGTVLGVAFGDVIGDPSRWGLDAAFPALFLALLVPQLRDRRSIQAAVARRGDRARAHPVHAGGRPDHRRQRRVLAGPRPCNCRRRARGAVAVSATWTVVIAVGAVTVAIKALGPMLLGGKQFPRRVTDVVALLAPALLAALVAVNTFGGDQDLVVDARVPGVLAGAVAIKLKAPVLVVVVVAALVTATVRAATG